MNFKKIIYFGLLGLFACSTYAATIPLKTECVGYYAVSLPENIETALYQIADVADGTKEQKIKFPDNKITYYSTFSYDYITLKITTKGEIELKNYIDFTRKQTDKFVKKDPENLSYMTPKITGVYSNSGLSLFYHDKRLYRFSTGKYGELSQKNKDYYKNTFFHLVNNFMPRELFELPKQQGFCIPYGYITSSPERFNSAMGITYRLTEHPDITIFFAVASTEKEFRYDNRKNAKDMVKEFWDSTYDNDVKEHHLLGFPRYKSIKMDGRRGKGAFVEIRYKDGRAPDYGYYSLVPLVAEADKDTPELSMYVIGKASESKGKTPLTKDEIYDLAKAIEASIQRRVFK